MTTSAPYFFCSDSRSAFAASSDMSAGLFIGMPRPIGAVGAAPFGFFAFAFFSPVAGFAAGAGPSGLAVGLARGVEDMTLGE